MVVMSLASSRRWFSLSTLAGLEIIRLGSMGGAGAGVGLLLLFLSMTLLSAESIPLP